MVRAFKDSEICKAFTHQDKAKIIEYIEILYNQKSVLNTIENLGDRKIEACLKVGLNPEDPDVIDNIMNFKDEEISSLIFHYLSFYQNNNRFHKLCSDQQLFWNMQRLMYMVLDNDLDDQHVESKMKLRANISKESDELMSRIDRLYSEIYGTNDVIQMAELNIRKLLTPEQRLRHTNV